MFLIALLHWVHSCCANPYPQGSKLWKSMLPPPHPQYIKNMRGEQRNAGDTAAFKQISLKYTGRASGDKQKGHELGTGRTSFQVSGRAESVRVLAGIVPFISELEDLVHVNHLCHEPFSLFSWRWASWPDFPVAFSPSHPMLLANLAKTHLPQTDGSWYCPSPTHPSTPSSWCP